MATTTSSTLANEYQKYFTKKLLKHAIQKTVLDQFALKAKLPKNVGAKIISFFRRSASVANPATGYVDGVKTLAEGVVINSPTDFTVLRVDVPLVQYGEYAKITDIADMTSLFDAVDMNIEGMSEDCALNNDSITRNALVAASQTGITQNLASGTTTEYIPKMYAQGITSFANLGAASTSGGKLTATDFIAAATKLKIARADTWDGMYVAVIPAQVEFDLQNDPDWIDASNFGDPDRRFKGEIKNFGGCRFVMQTNPFIEDGTGTEGVFANVTTVAAASRVYRTFVLGKDSYGVPAIEGDNPFSPKIMIVPPGKPSIADPLGQLGTAGWKSYWAAQALNPQFAVSLSGKTDFPG